ncbi:hypothetical protein LCGC14_2464060 [marine sediment metagenome]|uniref:Uncharacterized protein n=1 Tax=marine sediment metagenome TaxID=412755 RepID=A0A0F9E694_9ZZZZ
MSEPTPTPWKSQGRLVNCAMGHLTEMWTLDKYIEGNAEANAEHIVRCVNAHDDLLEACKLGAIAATAVNSDVAQIIQAAIAKAENGEP